MTVVDEVLAGMMEYFDNKITLAGLDNIFGSYLENPEQYRIDNSEKLYDGMTTIISGNKDIEEFYYLLSALYKLTRKNTAYYELIKRVTKDTGLSKETKYFAYWQLACDVFVDSALDTYESTDLLDDLYEVIYQDYYSEVKDICMPIPMTLRNDELVIFITSQMLTLNHVPTKVLLDRCSIMDRVMHKKILVINTADILTPYGSVNWFGAREGNYNDVLTKQDYLDYEGRRFAFYQCPKAMPDISVIKEIVNVVREEKPAYIVSMGGANITADILSNIVPTLTIATVFSKRAQTRGAFQVTPHIPNDRDRKWLLRHGMNDLHFIQGLFSFSFKEQMHKYSRNELGIPENKIASVVIGARLDDEVDDEFMEVINALSGLDIYTVFVGNLTKYVNLKEQYKGTKEHLINLGFQDDVLAVCECCDLYINPRRRGGGSSAAEAMYKGLPVVTINYGDVATAVGNDFCVLDYDEMVKRVKKLVTDKDYYRNMSIKAKERAAVLMDSEQEFVRVIKDMESRETFW